MRDRNNDVQIRGSNTSVQVGGTT